MMKVSVKNNTNNTIHVPLLYFVPYSACVVESAAPGASAECIYKMPPENRDVQDAVLAWAQENNIDVTISFTPAVMPNPQSDPMPDPPVFDPMNPLGI